MGTWCALSWRWLSWATQHCPLVATGQSSQRRSAHSTPGFALPHKAAVGGLAHWRLAEELVDPVRQLHSDLSSILAGRRTCVDEEQLIIRVSASGLLSSRWSVDH